MKNQQLRTLLLVPAILVTLITATSAVQAVSTFFCHGTGWPSCRGIFTVARTDIAFDMAGSPALAVVDEFTKPTTTRDVLWSNLEMRGTTVTGESISATLDSSHQSSGTILSVGDTEFPATATMKFFFKMNVAGMILVSDRPAVFQGIINSIPPAPGDSLTLISGPVEFHQEGSTDNVGALKQSTVTFEQSKP